MSLLFPLAQVTQVSIGAETDDRISLTGSLMTRALTIGNGWNDVRVLCLLNMVGAASYGDQSVRFGLCNTTNAVLGDPTTHHWWGCYHDADATYNAGTTCAYYTASGNLRCARIVNGTLQNITNQTITTARLFSGDGTVARTVWGFRLDKTDPSDVIMGNIWRSATTDPTDVSIDSMVALAEGTAVTGYTQQAPTSSSGPFTIDEATNGPLNAFCFESRSSAIRVELAAVVIARIS